MEAVNKILWARVWHKNGSLQLTERMPIFSDLEDR